MVWLQRSGARLDASAVASDVTAEQPRALHEPVAPLRPAASVAGGRLAAQERSSERETKFADAGQLSTLVATRFVDAHGAPLAAVELRAVDEPEGAARSAADGRAELSLGAGIRVGLPGLLIFEARGAGLATDRQLAKVRPGERLLLGDWTLVAGGDVEGRVLDEDGRGLLGARVACLRPDTNPREWLGDRLAPLELLARPGARALSALDGSFLLDGVPAGSIRLVVAASDRPAAMSEPVDVPARGLVRGVTIRMDAANRGSSLAGIVLDPEGLGVPHAGVEITGGGTSYSITAGEDGRFELSLSHREPCDVSAFDPARRHREALLEGVQSGTTDLVLRLTSAPALEILVTTREGVPIEHHAVVTIAARSAEVLAFLPEAGRPAGRTVLGAPAQDFLVEVRASGWLPARLGPYSTRAPPARIEFQLDPAGGVSGVVESGGTPVEGAWVGLYEALRTRDTYNGFLLRTRREPLVSAASDARGAFVLSVERGGSFYLRVEADGYALAELGPLELSPEVMREERLELGLGGTLEVSVRSSSSGAPAGRHVAISRGDGLALTQRTDEQGHATFLNLTPGPWLVSLSKEEIDPRYGVGKESTRPAVEIPSNCRVLEGETTHVDLWLEQDQEGPCRLTGRLVIDGEPAQGWVASLDQDREAVLEPRPFAEPGVFRLAPEEPGSYRLNLRRVGTEPSAMLVILDPVELHDGEQFWSLELDTAVLEGTLRGADTALVFHRWRRGALACFAPLVPDASRGFRTRVPAGRGDLVRLDPDRPIEDQDPVVLCELVLEAGQTTAVDL